MKPQTEKLLQETASALLAYAEDLRAECKACKLTPDAAKARPDAARAAFQGVIGLIKIEGPDFSIAGETRS